MRELGAKGLGDAYSSTVKSLPGFDEAGRRSAAQSIANSTGIYKEELINFLYVPKIYSSEDVEFFENIVETTYGILTKVVQRFVEDPAYRKLFRFSPELEELILLEPGYECPIPIMRMDIFLNEDDGSFKFCEFNTDGTSAMNENREIAAALEATPAFAQMAQEHGGKLEPFELFDSWVLEFERICASYRDKNGDPLPANPHIAIVDFMEETTQEEVIHFRKRFEARGYRASVLEIRDLRYEAGELLSPEGERIDAVYRRAVSADVMRYYDEVTPFISAVKDGAVCLIGSFRTQIAHAKTIFEVFHREETAAFLTPEERAFIAAHVPYTAELTPVAIEEREALSTKDPWIIKPADGYAGAGVYAGVDCSQDEWEAVISRHAGEEYVLQEYCTQYETENIDPGYEMKAGQEVVACEASPHFEQYKNLTGLYTYGGKFAGVLARAGQENTITFEARDYTLGVFKLV